MVRNYLQLLLCPVVSIIAIHFLYGITDIDLSRLQCIQTRLACPVTKYPPFTRNAPLLRSLHWLPVRFRILFKVNLLAYKTLSEKQPVFLHSMLAVSLPSRSMRSNKDHSLSVPRVKTSTGARAFHSCAPYLLNNLAAISLFSRFSCYLQETSKDVSLWFGLSPIDTGTPDGLFLLLNCFFNFAAEHWFGCCANISGFARDIGTIEMLLIVIDER